jgi:hypothetical protein
LDQTPDFHEADSGNIKDVMEYGFHGLNQTPSVWAEQIKLPAPVLNISVFYPPAGENAQYLADRLAPYQDPSKTMYMLSDMNRTYDLGYVSEYGRCQSSSDVSIPTGLVTSTT